MNDERYWRAKELFVEARAQPAAERAAFLSAKCGGNAELRSDVESLLAAEQEATRDETLDHAPDPLLGRVIYDYRVVRLIASGGMGRVYEAEQSSPRRTVALKILKLGLVSSAAVRRFVSEGQILARLRHPGIAQVYQAGTLEVGGETVPFYAMEHIPSASPITHYAKERNLSTRDRLALFARVCDAVHHSHEKGIIHRDLKPANALVDEAGDPKLIDFGVARIVDRDTALSTMATEPGLLIGTLTYMSPEQCAGDSQDVDARGDIYSLGVMLYELLCWELPYDLRYLNWIRAIRVILEAPPRRPGALDRSLRGNVEAILLKALAKNRLDRYQTVADLARDIRGHLAGEAVEARGPHWWNPAMSWMRRHPKAVTTTLSTSIPLFALAVSYIIVGRIAREPDRIEISPDRAEAHLLSRRGLELHRWAPAYRSCAACTDAGVFPFAKIVPRADRFGGGRVLVLGRNHRPEDQELGGEVSVHDLDRPEPPIWTTRDHPIPRPDSRKEAAFHPGLWVVDAVPNLPGDEILITHRYQPYSQMLIRIFDGGGRIHYETWHDGGLAVEGLSLQPVGDSGRLVFCGVNGEYSWGNRGFLDLPLYPIVIFCLRSIDGHRRHFPGLVKNGKCVDETLLWYRWLGPADALAPFKSINAKVRAAPGKWHDGRHLAFSINGELRDANTPTVEVNLVLDEAGREVHRWADDNYKRARLKGLVPEASTYQLLDYTELPLPPVVHK